MAFKLHAYVVALPPVQPILTEHPSVPGTLLDFGETVVTVTSSLPSKGDILVRVEGWWERVAEKQVTKQTQDRFRCCEVLRFVRWDDGGLWRR